MGLPSNSLPTPSFCPPQTILLLNFTFHKFIEAPRKISIKARCDYQFKISGAFPNAEKTNEKANTNLFALCHTQKKIEDSFYANPVDESWNSFWWGGLMSAISIPWYLRTKKNSIPFLFKVVSSAMFFWYNFFDFAIYFRHLFSTS